MYGKHFESMYTGSMVGKGSAFFAVWGYVISHFRLNKDGVGMVELNPLLLSVVIGEDEGVIEGVIDRMCSPDPKSRSQVEGGRKLEKVGVYEYRVVNGGMYRSIRSQEDRLEYQRMKQAEYRKRRKEILKDAAVRDGAQGAIRDGFAGLAGVVEKKGNGGNHE